MAYDCASLGPSSPPRRAIFYYFPDHVNIADIIISIKNAMITAERMIRSKYLLFNSSTINSVVSFCSLKSDNAPPSSSLVSVLTLYIFLLVIYIFHFIFYYNEHVSSLAISREDLITGMYQSRILKSCLIPTARNSTMHRSSLGLPSTTKSIRIFPVADCSLPLARRQQTPPKDQKSFQCLPHQPNF